MRPHRAAIVTILGLTLAVAAANTVEPLVLMHLVDGLTSNEPLVSA